MLHGECLCVFRPGARERGGLLLTLRAAGKTVSVTPAQYFSRRRGLANGIVFAGGGLGGAVTSFGLDAMIGRFGLPWTYRLLGLATLVTGIPAALLIKERVPIRSAAFVEW